MASLKDLIVQGVSRFIGNVYGSKFITDGGTSSQFVKGDGTLDSSTYLTQTSLGTGNPDLAAIEALSGTSGFLKKTAANTWALDSKVVLDKGGTGNNLSTSVIDGGDTNEDLVITNNGHNSCVNVNPMGVDIISNWGGATNNSNNSGTNNVNVNTGAGKLYYNGNEVATFPSNGTSSQFLKADGSVDSTAYGTYSKPNGGIPKTDLASDVQALLDSNSNGGNIIVDLTFDSNSSLWNTDAEHSIFVYSSTQTLEELCQIGNSGINIIFRLDLTPVGTLSSGSIAPQPGYYSALTVQVDYYPEESEYYLVASYCGNEQRSLVDGSFNFSIVPSTINSNNTKWQIYFQDLQKQKSIIDGLVNEVKSVNQNWIPGDPQVESIINGILSRDSNDKYVALSEVTDAIDDLQNEPFKTINGNSIKGTGNIYLVEDKEAPYRNQYFTITVYDRTTIYWKTNNASCAKTISVSTDNGQTWTRYTSSVSGTQIAFLVAPQKLLIKGSSARYTNSSTSSYNYFTCQDLINVEGNIMSLIYGDDFVNRTTLNNDNTYAFCSLFANCTYLRSAQNLILPLNTSSFCYDSMFLGCTSLTSIPKLPAVTLEQGCYRGMFASCANLTTAPELPATSLAAQCYEGMFAETRLLTAPKLPATTLAEGCYQNMFAGCYNLRTTPELSATTLSQNCYKSMFGGCTSLTTAPELPATTLATGCYSGMFYGCTKLTTAPQLPTTILTDGCYYNMFYGCINLNYVKCLATNISAEDCTYQWLYQVSPTGTFVKNSSMSSWSRGQSSIPSTWNICDNGYDSYAGSTIPAGPANKAVSIPFGQVDSTSTSTVFTATIDGITELRDGVCCYLRNGYIASASGCTLNINNLGAKPMYITSNSSTRVTTQFSVGYTYLFVYNSSRVEDGCWDLYQGVTVATASAQYIGGNSGSTLPAAQKFYRYRILFTSADGTHYVPANTSTSTNATASRTVNQTPINPFGTILYYNTTAAINAEAIVSNTNAYVMFGMTLGYSFNRTGAALTLTTNTPVYIKCAPQSDGSAIIDADNPYVQALPTTDDGKIYIYLGNAYSATAVQLVPNHPVYYYKDGAIRLWTAEASRIAALEARIAALEQIIQGS